MVKVRISRWDLTCFCLFLLFNHLCLPSHLFTVTFGCMCRVVAYANVWSRGGPWAQCPSAMLTSKVMSFSHLIVSLLAFAVVAGVIHDPAAFWAWIDHSSAPGILGLTLATPDTGDILRLWLWRPLNSAWVNCSEALPMEPSCPYFGNPFWKLPARVANISGTCIYH